MKNKQKYFIDDKPSQFEGKQILQTLDKNNFIIFNREKSIKYLVEEKIEEYNLIELVGQMFL
jgi:hypothetical protein